MDYKPVKLKPEDQTKMRAHNDKVAGVQNFVAMMTQSGEARLSQLQTEGRTLWEEFDKTYGLDLNHVAYEPSRDGTTLLPKMVKLGGE